MQHVKSTEHLIIGKLARKNREQMIDYLRPPHPHSRSERPPTNRRTARPAFLIVYMSQLTSILHLCTRVLCFLFVLASPSSDNSHIRVAESCDHNDGLETTGGTVVIPNELSNTSKGLILLQREKRKDRGLERLDPSSLLRSARVETEHA